MQYARLKNLLKISKREGGDTTVSLPLDVFMEILSAAVHATPHFDEADYVTRRPDVAEAVSKGVIASAREHYARAGYFEDILPGRVLIDESYYLNSNQDVAKAFKRGEVRDPQQHFEAMGYQEGRLPREAFSVWNVFKQQEAK